MIPLANTRSAVKNKNNIFTFFGFKYFFELKKTVKNDNMMKITKIKI